MIITKLTLPRRTFLRGAGATLALPLLESMIPALSALTRTAAAPVPRLAFLYIPNGVVLDKWTPAAQGTEFELPPTLTPLAPFRSRLSVVSGLGHRQAESNGDGNGDHSRAAATWLSGVRAKRTEGADVRGGMTVDQLAAAEFGRHTRLPSLELALEANYLVGNCDVGYSCVYMNTISWRTPTTPLPMENNPRVVFQRLFGDGGTPAERLVQIRRDRSILDSVTAATDRLTSTLGPSDRTRLEEYLEAVRDIERRLQKAEQQADLALPVPERPVTVPDSFEEHIKLMFDLQVLAFQADVTRVISFLIGRELSSRTYPQIGVPDPHHGISHHENNPEKLVKLQRIDTYHVQMLAYFLEKLASTPDGDGSLLDHLLLLYGGGISDGNLHNHARLPLLLAGGGAGQHKGGRHLRYADDTPMANLLLTMLGLAGVPTERFGDSTGHLPLEHLSGL
jgi:hypothetical protein